MNHFRLVLQVGLVALGLLHAAGYVFQLPTLRGVAMATTASPLPLVFSHFRGLETFSSRFQAQITTQDPEGEKIHSIELTPAVYSQFEGPYNRRNVYGAVVAYGVKMTEGNEPKLVQDVLTFGFCREAPVLRSFGFTQSVRAVTISVSNDQQTPPLRENLSVKCPL